jgi:hypothetical protein
MVDTKGEKDIKTVKVFNKRPHGVMVVVFGLHPKGSGSIPLGGTKKFDLFDFLLYICVNINDCGVGVVSL